MTGCLGDGKPDTDYEAIGQCAVDYMKEKYGVDFELSNHIVPMGNDFAEIRGYVDGNEEVKYIVYACADEVDEDNDGYADSYTIIGDNYMCTLIQPLIKKGMDELVLSSDEFEKLNLLTYVSRPQQRDVMANFSGFTKDFLLYEIVDFNLINIIDSYKISFDFSIRISESQYTDDLENKLLSDFGSIFANDYIVCNIYVNTDEDFEIIKQAYENNEKLDKNFSEVKKISFQLK